MEKQAKGLKRRITILTISLWISLISDVAKAHPVVQFWQNRTTSSSGLVLEPRISLFSTSENYDAVSAKGPLLPGTSVNRVYVDLNANYSVSDNFYLFGRLSAIRSEIQTFAGNGSTAGLGDQLLGAAYRLYAKPNGISISAQVDVVIPGYSTSSQRNNGQPYLGDGTTEAIVGGFIEAPLPFGRMGDWFGELGMGYRVRSNSFSAAVPWTLMIKREPENSGLLFQAGARGQFSLNTDPTLPSAALVDQQIGGAGSALVYALNPAWLAGQLMLGYKSKQGQSFYALAAMPVTGKNAPGGLQISIGAQFDFASPLSGSEGDNIQRPQRIERPPVQAARVNPTKAITPGGRSGEFSSYNLQTLVTSVNDQLYIAKVDKGIDDGIEKGQIFDIFQDIEDPITNKHREVRVARAKVISVKTSETALNVIEYYLDQWVEVGFIARRLVQ